MFHFDDRFRECKCVIVCPKVDIQYLAVVHLVHFVGQPHLFWVGFGFRFAFCPKA